jgi:DNA-binding response OmpR family regulator
MLERYKIMKILVAEDEVNIAESYKLMLEFKGHEVTLTGDGEKCLDVYKQSLSSSPRASMFDLVILDYRMPKKDGVQVAQEILGIVPTQRILLATAFVHDISISRLQEIPATKSVELIQKPFDFDSFLNMVHNHGSNLGTEIPNLQNSELGSFSHVNNNAHSTGSNTEPSAVRAGTLSSSNANPLDSGHRIVIEDLEGLRLDDSGNCNCNQFDDQLLCLAENETMRMIF